MRTLTKETDALHLAYACALYNWLTYLNQEKNNLIEAIVYYKPAYLQLYMRQYLAKINHENLNSKISLRHLKQKTTGLIKDITQKENEIISSSTRPNRFMHYLLIEDKHSFSYLIRKRLINFLDRLVDNEENQLETRHPAIHTTSVHALGLGFFCIDYLWASKHNLVSFLLTDWVTRIILPSYNTLSNFFNRLGLPTFEIKLIDFYPSIRTALHLTLSSLFNAFLFDQSLAMAALLAIPPMLLQALEFKTLQAYCPTLYATLNRTPELQGVLSYFNYYLNYFIVGKGVSFFPSKPPQQRTFEFNPEYSSGEHCDLNHHFNHSTFPEFRRCYRQWIRFFNDENNTKSILNINEMYDIKKGMH